MFDENCCARIVLFVEYLSFFFVFSKQFCVYSPWRRNYIQLLQTVSFSLCTSFNEFASRRIEFQLLLKWSVRAKFGTFEKQPTKLKFIGIVLVPIRQRTRISLPFRSPFIWCWVLYVQQQQQQQQRWIACTSSIHAQYLLKFYLYMYNVYVLSTATYSSTSLFLLTLFGWALVVYFSMFVFEQDIVY